MEYNSDTKKFLPYIYPVFLINLIRYLMSWGIPQYSKKKISVEEDMKAQRSNSGIALLFLWPRRWKGVGGQGHAPLERLSVPVVQDWVGRSAGLDGCGKSRSRPAFDPQTVQLVSSRCTDYAIPPYEGFLSFMLNRTSSIVAAKWTAHVGSQAEGRRCAHSFFQSLLDSTTQKGNEDKAVVPSHCGR